MLEVISETVQDAITAEAAGADRIELVSALCDGGLTPSIALVEHVCQAVKIPVRVMLRPHSRSFQYDRYDQDVILTDLAKIQQTPAEGIVFGALNQEGDIDESLLEKIIHQKGFLKLTFHRAIDEAHDFAQALKVLTRYPVDTLLTSGGQTDVMASIPVYHQYKDNLTRHQIEWLAGKGVTLDNLEELLDQTFLSSIHMGSGVQADGHVDFQKVEKAKHIIISRRKSKEIL